jgi:D-alanyl-lipoteichoic acid acyltransferase DltB (MBOAT superfamily)
VDAYNGKVERFNLLDYSLFVTFFPQLVAGPIVHHSEVIPQFRKAGSVPAKYFAHGITILTIGLAKKVLFADTVAFYASPQFAAVATGAKLDLLAAWSAAFAYTAQLYFDFSGYSDMAIGGALLFGIRLPINFNSPYKSASIIEFWRRWAYHPLALLARLSLYSTGRQPEGPYSTLCEPVYYHATGRDMARRRMDIRDLGALHGIYLTINQGWRILIEKLGLLSESSNVLGYRIGQVTTFLAVVVAWVFFRSENVSSAVEMLKAMGGHNGITVPASLASLVAGPPQSQGPVDSGIALLVSFFFLVIAWIAPNTQQLTAVCRSPRHLLLQR